MEINATRNLLDLMRAQVRQTKSAYYSAMPGVTYDDMARSARRYLEMVNTVERMRGRKAKPITAKHIASLLRMD